jgi:hypothetical protein
VPSSKRSLIRPVSGHCQPGGSKSAIRAPSGNSEFQVRPIGLSGLEASGKTSQQGAAAFLPKPQHLPSISMRSDFNYRPGPCISSQQDSAGFERGRLYSAPTRSRWRRASSFLPTQLDVGSEQQYVCLEDAALKLYGLILMRRSVFPDRTRITNSSSLIYYQNSLFRSPGNSREKATKEAHLSTRWMACNDLKTRNSLYFPC